MKKKIFLITLIVMAIVCIFAISASAESAYVNADGVQVSADSSDIAYELEFTSPWDTGGGCRLAYVYLHDTSITKLVIPEVELTNSKGTVYKMSEYSYVRLSTGWGSTLSVYALADKETKANSLHTQIKELELHIPVLGDGAGSQGNLAGWSGLEKLSFFYKAYEPQNKGGFLSGCTSLKEIHFYGKNNELSGNFFPNTVVAGGKVVFHENATGVIRSTAMQGLNSGKDITVYLNTAMQPQNAEDPRLTWNKNNSGLLKFVLLVNDKSIYTEEQIASYPTNWQAGNNANVNNATYSMPIKTYCEFYEAHLNKQVLSSCLSKCLTCNEIEIPENPVHSMTTTMEYTSYLEAGTKTTKCEVEGCPLNAEESVETVPALFVSLGYSAPEYSGSTGIAVGFAANEAAISEYTEVTGKSVGYGLFAVLKDRIGDNDIFASDGTAADGVVSTNISRFGYEIFEIKIVGFGEEHKDMKIAMGAYVEVTDGEATEYIYLQSGTPEENERYCFVSYNDVVAPANNEE